MFSALVSSLDMAAAATYWNAEMQPNAPNCPIEGIHGCGQHTVVWYYYIITLLALLFTCLRLNY